MSWASFHVVEVMSSSRFHLKSIGYLGAVQSFKENTDVLMLTTNTLKKASLLSSTPNLSRRSLWMGYLLSPRTLHPLIHMRYLSLWMACPTL